MQKQRGKKTCKKCGSLNGARAYNCVNCGNEFDIKSVKTKKIFRKKVRDWKELNSGDCIRVISGTGPYYDKELGKQSVGHNGKFIVMGLDKNGILGFGCSKNNSGYAHIYMGETVESPVVPNLIRSAHKIIFSRKDR